MNGASTGTKSFKYIQEKGYKIVFLDLDAFATAKNSANISVFQLPSSLAPNVDFNVECNATTELIVHKDGSTTFYTSDPNDKTIGLQFMHVHAVFTHFD